MKFSSNTDNGLLDSSFYLNANNDSANVNVNISSGALNTNEMNTLVPTIMVKYTTMLHYVLVKKLKTQVVV